VRDEANLGLRLGFRVAEGFAERLVYREFFPRGLTALDSLDAITLAEQSSLLRVTARQEVRSLIDA
jgi:chromosome partitioning protein